MEKRKLPVARSVVRTEINDVGSAQDDCAPADTAGLLDDDRLRERAGDADGDRAAAP
ncbi:hypothetical protein [Streptomyces sp. HB132]|uniref:hypothetical protein n=1 Tax=Streptomyces sp. HB132 TaxID=767388 RepID=UPI0019615FD9|nr:hypothetical protein [Streptomyces sp. HB132]MBM7439509.1 hypothetical protein [Streptomyces sp. HB132]